MRPQLASSDDSYKSIGVSRRGHASAAAYASVMEANAGERIMWKRIAGVLTVGACVWAMSGCTLGGAAAGGYAGHELTGGSTAGTVGGAVVGGVIGHELGK